MPLIDSLFSVGVLRQAVWRCWYPFLTRRLRREDVLFLNYAFETAPPLGLLLAPSDEPDRACIQLYHHVATQVELRGKKILEVSCGHGGGASYLTRTLHPAHYTGLDLNRAGITFCRQRHQLEELDFLAGDAQRLMFADHTFDVVLNIEASHCYPDFDRFLAEVARVLRPGGHFLYADFRFSDGLAGWAQSFAASPFEQLQTRNINAEVLRGLDLNSARSQRLILRHLPSCLQSLGRDFAGLPGSRLYAALQQGVLAYRSFSFRKP